MKKFEKEINKFLNETIVKLKYQDNDKLYQIYKMFNKKEIIIINVKNV